MKNRAAAVFTFTAPITERMQTDLLAAVSSFICSERHVFMHVSWSRPRTPSMDFNCLSSIKHSPDCPQWRANYKIDTDMPSWLSSTRTVHVPNLFSFSGQLAACWVDLYRRCIIFCLYNSKSRWRLEVLTSKSTAAIPIKHTSF